MTRDRKPLYVAPPPRSLQRKPRLLRKKPPLQRDTRTLSQSPSSPDVESDRTQSYNDPPKHSTQDTRMMSQAPPSLDIDATNPQGRSGSDEFNEEERNDPYENFFQSSQSNLSSSSDLSPTCRFWKALRPSVNIPMRLQGRLNHHFFARRPGGKDAKSTSTDDPHPRRFWKVPCLPVNKSMILQGRLNRHLFTRRGGGKDTVREKDPAGGQDTDGGEDTAGKKDTAGGKDTTGGNDTWSVSDAPAKFACGPSSKVVEIYAARGFLRYVVVKRKPKTGTSSSDCSDSSSNCSDSSIQGGWNKFLVKICYPCGRYYEDD